MRIYLDDDRDSRLLLLLLREAGHQVVSPRDIGNRHISDREHMVYAADHQLAILTTNKKDFIPLHQQWIHSRRQHYGVLIVNFDHDTHRDMKPQDIVRAINRLESSGIPLENEVHHLNQWRF